MNDLRTYVCMCVCTYVYMYVCMCFLSSYKHAPLNCVILHAVLALIYLLFIL